MSTKGSKRSAAATEAPHEETQKKQKDSTGSAVAADLMTGVTATPPAPAAPPVVYQPGVPLELDLFSRDARRSIAKVLNDSKARVSIRRRCAFEKSTSPETLAKLFLRVKPSDDKQFQDWLYDICVPGETEPESHMIHPPPLLLRKNYYIGVGTMSGDDGKDLKRDYFMQFAVVIDKNIAARSKNYAGRLKLFAERMILVEKRYKELLFQEPTFRPEARTEAMKQAFSDLKNSLRDAHLDDEAKTVKIGDPRVRERAIEIFFEGGRFWNEHVDEIPLTEEDREAMIAAGQEPGKVAELKTKKKKVVDGQIRVRGKVFFPKRDDDYSSASRAKPAAAPVAAAPVVASSLSALTGTRAMANSAAPAGTPGSNGQKKKKGMGILKERADIERVLQTAEAAGYAYQVPKWYDKEGEEIPVPEGAFAPLYVIAQQNDLVECAFKPHPFSTKGDKYGCHLFKVGIPYLIMNGPGPDENTMDQGEEGMEAEDDLAGLDMDALRSAVITAQGIATGLDEI